MAVMHVGAPAPGMNAATRALTRLAIDAGYDMYGVFESTRGLSEGDVRKLNWIDVDGWCDQGGSFLGTNRESPHKVIKKCAETVEKLGLKSLFIIGGWEALVTAEALSKAALEFPAFRIPIITLPATISNNVPGTDVAIGCDTALNTIVESSDRLKQSAVASRCRVFIMEVHGGRCGYLATAATLGGGGHITYTPEQGITLRRLCDDIDSLKLRFQSCKTMALIINTEHSSHTYTTDLIEKVIIEEAKDDFDARKLILGHIQQGNAPSPEDRILAADLAFMAIDTAQKFLASNHGETLVGAVGSSGTDLVFTTMEDLIPNMDFENRRPATHNWGHLVACINSLRRVSPLPPPDISFPRRLRQPMGIPLSTQ